MNSMNFELKKKFIYITPFGDSNSFLVPFNHSGKVYCPASILKFYFEKINEDLEKLINVKKT